MEKITSRLFIPTNPPGVHSLDPGISTSLLLDPSKTDGSEALQARVSTVSYWAEVWKGYAG